MSKCYLLQRRWRLCALFANRKIGDSSKQEGMQKSRCFLLFLNLYSTFLRFIRLPMEMVVLQDCFRHICLSAQVTILRGSILFDSVILENRDEYYRVLFESQKNWQTEDEDISPWVEFYIHEIYSQYIRAYQRVLDNFDYRNTPLFAWELAESEGLSFIGTELTELTNERWNESVTWDYYEWAFWQTNRVCCVHW